MPSTVLTTATPSSTKASIGSAEATTTVNGTKTPGDDASIQSITGAANGAPAPGPKPDSQLPNDSNETSTFVGTVVGTTKPLLAKTRPTRAINRLKPTSIGLWSLKNTSSKAPESAEALAITNGRASVGETVFGSDDRKKVDKKDFGPGGKYYSIVKLFMSYQTKTGPLRAFIGTGWLIAADIIVTAGHCAYDWEHHLGQAVEIKAYIGYDGRQSIGSSGVQFRKGVSIATTADWLKCGEAHHDVSFIRVLSPFTGVTPFKYADTPSFGNATLGVVGFPGDLDRGEHMYECFMPAKYSITKGKGMLQYKIDTFGGNSGAPVLQQKDGVAIGVHVMGGAINQASLIGALGNAFPLFVQALRFNHAKLAKAPLEVSIVEMKPTLESADEAFQADPNGAAESYGNDEAGDEAGVDPSTNAYRFRELFLKAQAFTKDADDRLSATGMPASLGPPGAHAAVFGHSLMQYVARRAKSSSGSGEASGDSGEHVDEAGVFDKDGAMVPELLSHGVLCEAALEALMTLDPKTLSKEKVFDRLATHSAESFGGALKSIWDRRLATPGTIGAHIAFVACAAAAGTAVSGVSSLFRKSKKESTEGVDDSKDQPNGVPSGDETSSPPSGQPPKAPVEPATTFLGALQAHANEQHEGQELFTRLITPNAPTLSESLSAIGEGMPAGDEAADAFAENTLADGLMSRVLLGEAALRTLQELSPEVAHSESFLSKVWGSVKKVGSFALQVGPSLILPAVGGKIWDKVKALKLGKKESDENDGMADGKTDGNEAGEAQEGNADGEGDAGSGEADDAGDEAGDEADPEVEAMESFQDWYNSQMATTKAQT